MMMYHYGTRRTGHLPFMALAIGIGAGLVGLGLHPGQPIASFSIPLLGVAVAGVVLHVLRSPRSRRKKSRLHDSGAPLIHIGVILMLIGYAGSTFLAHERTVTLSEGAPVGFEGYDLVLESKDEGDDHIFLNIVVKKDDGTLGRARPGLKVIDGQTRAEVSVVKVPGKDLRFVLGGWDDVLETELGTRAKVEVRSLPAMNLLWGGAFMIVAGTALRFFPSGPHYDSEPRGPVPLRRPFDAEE
jgi:cytochrome c biogenesis factor